MGIDRLGSRNPAIWFRERLDGISMQLQLNVAVRQKTFVAQLNTRPGFS